jgi:drug/metabolite transporter (DMT)-like permease
MTDQAPPVAQTEYTRASFALLALLTFFWGINWPFMKIVLSELPVWWFRASCLLIGAIGLLSASALGGNSLKVPRSEMPQLVLCSVFSVVGWHLFSAYGLSLIPAGRAVIIAFTMPIWAALWAVWILKESMTRYKVGGLAFGLGGLLVLMGSDIMVWQVAPLGVLLMLCSAASWGLGTVLFKRFRWSIPVATNIGWQLCVAVIPITFGAIVLEPFPDFSNLSPAATWSLIYVYMFPMIFCQWAYFKIVGMFPATVAALGTLAIPVVGVYSSAMVLGEPLGVQEFAAMVMICMALAFVLVLPTLKFRKN